MLIANRNSQKVIFRYFMSP